MTSGIAARENNNENHPLLTEVISDCIFGYLPTNDILNCRLVCYSWKSASQNILRKRVTINFLTLGPSTFLNVFNHSFATDFAFQNFNFPEEGKIGKVSEIQNFFDKWGPNIEKLSFAKNWLYTFRKKKPLNSFDITPWILKATNLIELQVVNYNSRALRDKGTLFKIQLSKLSFIKHLSFYGEGCLISIEDILQSNQKIKPVKIAVSTAGFLKGKTRLRNLCLNDIIDFCETAEIRLINTAQTEIGSAILTIDIASWFLKLQFININSMGGIINWTEARGSIYFVEISHLNYIRNNLKVQQIYSRYAYIALSAFPTTLEKLHFSPSSFVSSTDFKCQFPKLKYLRWDNCSTFFLMSNFSQCSNLIEIELGESCVNQKNVTVNVHWIPKSVKRLKINSMQVRICHSDERENNVGEQLQDDGYVLNLDTLILEDYLHCLDTYVSKIISKIKPSVLVVTCVDARKEINTASIYGFVCANRQLEKIVVGSTEDLYKNTPFKSSLLSQIVKEKADYYVFENLVEKEHKGNEENKALLGKPISYGGFCNYRKMDVLDRRFAIGDNLHCIDWKK